MAKPAKDKFDPKTFLAKVGAGKSISKLGKGQNVFVQGDVADAVFYIQKGKIKLTVVSDQGTEAVVGMLEPGQFYGEGCLNGQPLRIATTTAIEDCVITRISKPAMIAALEVRPSSSAECFRPFGNNKFAQPSLDSRAESANTAATRSQ